MRFPEAIGCRNLLLVYEIFRLYVCHRIKARTENTR